MELNDKELVKYEIIEMVVLGKKTRKEASFELNLSLKQIDRLKNVYITCGKVGFVHKNRGKNNPNKKDRKLIKGLEQFFEEIEENIIFHILSCLMNLKRMI